MWADFVNLARLPERSGRQANASISSAEEIKYITLLSCFSFIVLRYSPLV
jgi:hypothetical protein